MKYKNQADQAAAARRHYLANRETMIARAAAHNKVTRQRVQEWLREAKNVPCADCGERYPYYVMQFDHIGSDKVFNVSQYGRGGKSLAKVQAEAAKCEVVCANCHALRTHHRRSEVAGVGFEPTT